MKFKISRVRHYADVQFEHNETAVGLGVIDPGQIDEMAQHLVETIWQIGPSGTDKCRQWMAERFAAAGVPLPVKAEEVAS